MACKICNVRRPRRSCPGVGGEICSVCCGTEREVTVSCPLDCDYLREARTHEKPPRVDPQQIPNLDIEVSDSFLREREALVAFLMQAVAEAGLRTPKAVDYDVRAALDALVRTCRTRETGLYYETRPDNLLAAAVLDHIQKNLEEFRKAAAKRHGIEVTRDADVLGVLVFLQRIEYQINNGRQRGRAFLDFLRSQVESAPGPQTQPGSSLVLL
jgi:hypothetical protein